jgi:3-oxoisoapionate decarboxylase
MPIPFVLTAYAIPHLMGYLATRSGENYLKPLGPLGLMDAAKQFELVGVDMPLPNTLSAEEISTALTERGLKLVVESMSVLELPFEEISELLKKAAACGASVVRFVLSSLLCGDRRPLGPGGWEQRLVAITERLRLILPLAEGLGLSLALENHQDATTSDLIRLYEASGESVAFGVCLDAGNPLAVGEDPVEAARRLAPLIRHLHCKDYTIHFAPNGYHLVRCAAGTGVVDFPQILALVRGNGFDLLLPGIEIAAQQTRTIPMLEKSWWAEHAPREATELLGALQILWKSGRPLGEAYASAWERGENSEAVSAEEWKLLRESVAYFGGLSQ